MKTFLIILQMNLLVLLFSSQSLAMKREKRAWDKENHAPVSKRQELIPVAELKNVKKASYAALLSEIYRESQAGGAHKKLLLKVVQRLFSKVSKNHWQLMLVVPDPSMHGRTLNLLLAYHGPGDIEAISFERFDENEILMCNARQFLEFKFSTLYGENETIVSESEGAHAQNKLKELIFALVALLKPSFGVDSKSFPKELLENQLSLHEGEMLFANNQQRTLIEKMFILNNGHFLSDKDNPLWIEIKPGIFFTFRVSAEKYESNCLSVNNFHSPDSLLYYSIKLIMWDSNNGAEREKATAFLQIALDQGFGESNLPSEVVWMQNENGVTGKEILSFLNLVMAFLEPKIIYLTDDAKKFDIALRILRPVWQGQGFYQEYGKFSLVETQELVNHEGVLIKQDRATYEDTVKYLREFPVHNLASLITPQAGERLRVVLEKYPNAGTFSKLLNESFLQDAAGDFKFLGSTFLTLKNNDALVAEAFITRLLHLDSARLLSLEFK